MLRPGGVVVVAAGEGQGPAPRSAAWRSGTVTAIRFRNPRVAVRGAVERFVKGAGVKVDARGRAGPAPQACHLRAQPLRFQAHVCGRRLGPLLRRFSQVDSAARGRAGRLRLGSHPAQVQLQAQNGGAHLVSRLEGLPLPARQHRGTPPRTQHASSQSLLPVVEGSRGAADVHRARRGGTAPNAYQAALIMAAPAQRSPAKVVVAAPSDAPVHPERVEGAGREVKRRAHPAAHGSGGEAARNGRARAAGA
mmetsp:Transcript_9365/g.27281  ORF Transcript_9365/g.27281 Transcript_9365/m.27281 type:complete len:250 (-) Transcript_9365:73-822(-)